MQSQSHIKTYTDQTEEQMLEMFITSGKFKNPYEEEYLNPKKHTVQILSPTEHIIEIDPYEYYQANKDNLY